MCLPRISYCANIDNEDDCNTQYNCTWTTHGNGPSYVTINPNVFIYNNGDVCTSTNNKCMSIGSVGPKGDKGDTGLTGPKGDKGDTGMAGKNGSIGPVGPPGVVSGWTGKCPALYSLTVKNGLVTGCSLR